jgi:nucleolar complex protein 2
MTKHRGAAHGISFFLASLAKTAVKTTSVKFSYKHRRLFQGKMAKGKATKKFEKRHLKDVLKQRGAVSKIKKSKQLKEKKRARAARDASPQGGEVAEPSVTNGRKPTTVEDDFFQSGFDLPERAKTKRKAAPSGSSAAKLKKAKVNHDDSNSDASLPEEHRTGGVVDAADESGEEAEDDEVAHKTQLETLKKKDPEFYKYLEENDEELLQFEDDDLVGIDLLSDDDASASKPGKESESKGRPVDAGLVERWRLALVEGHSLRSTRELVLAFRAAVHASEESTTKFRYSIPSPEGINPLD